MNFPNFTGYSNKRTGKYTAPRCKKKILQDSFLNSAIKLYNELPIDLRSEEISYNKFKKLLFCHLSKKQFNGPGLRTRNTWKGFKIT